MRKVEVNTGISNFAERIAKLDAYYINSGDVPKSLGLDEASFKMLVVGLTDGEYELQLSKRGGGSIKV